MQRVDEREVLVVGGGGAGEVAGLLDQDLLGAEQLGELLAEPLAGVDGVELDVAEGVAGTSWPAGLDLGDDRSPRPAPSETKMLTQPTRSMTARRRLASAARSMSASGTKTAWTSQRRGARPMSGSHSARSSQRAVGAGRRGGEPAAVAAHDLVDDQHARVGVVLGDDVAAKQRALLGGGPGAERLPDRDDVVVDRLGQADDGELVVVLGQIGGEVGGRGVGVVAADGVEDVDAVVGELVGGDVQRVLRPP